MTRITCKCKVCKDNATRFGLPFPLQADVPDTLAARIKKPHGYVHQAHDPAPVAECVRRATGIVPVR